MIMNNQKAFSNLRANYRGEKPRNVGVTEIRGPYYTVMGKRYLSDVLETMGEHVDILKFAGGSFTLMPEKQLRELLDLDHQYDVKVYTGGFMETVLTKGTKAVDYYINECKPFVVDIIVISTGFISMPINDIVRLVDRQNKADHLAKPKNSVQFGDDRTNTNEQEEASLINIPTRASGI